MPFVPCVSDLIFLQPTMILGRVAYLGVLSRRSAVTTAGVLILIVSRPPSISLTTLTLSPSNDTSDAKVPCNMKIQYDHKTKSTNNKNYCHNALSGKQRNIFEHCHI